MRASSRNLAFKNIILKINHFSRYREPLEVHYVMFYEINKHFEQLVVLFARVEIRAIYRTQILSRAAWLAV